MALVLITHDMGVVAETAKRVVVMYAGQQVEQQEANGLFATPHHPYTHALLDALPERSLGLDRLPTIEGIVPGAGDRPDGCLFSPRCKYVQDDCRASVPPLENISDTTLRCFHPVDLEGQAT
jgi:dipeptide transport system ATP-binding protein